MESTYALKKYPKVRWVMEEECILKADVLSTIPININSITEAGIRGREVELDNWSLVRDEGNFSIGALERTFN